MDSNIAQELNVLNTDRLNCITNLTKKGVNADNTYGFSQIASKILEIPSDKLTSVYVDNEISYRKQVPSNSVGVCYLNSIGGMTYKGFTFDCVVEEFNGEYSAPYSFTFPKAFTFPTDDLYAFAPIVCGRTDAPIVDASAFYTLSGTSMTGQGTMFVTDITAGTQLRCIPRFENQSTAEYWFPPDCYTGLRDAKPTEVKSYGANMLNISQFGKSQGTLNDDGSLNITTGSNSFNGSALLTGLLPEGTYTISVIEGLSVFVMQTDGDYSKRCDVGKTYTFTYDGISYLRIVGGTQTANTSITYKIMLNLGTTALPYSPYRAPITYTLPESITEKLGKGCSDTIFDEYSFVDEKAVERVESTTVNGDMITGFYEGGAVTLKSRYQFVVPVSDMKILNGYTQYGKILTPFFPNIGSVDSANANQTNLYQVAYTTLSDKPNLFYYLPLEFFGDTAADYSKGKAWFNSAKLPIVYEKETYTETSIDTDFNPLIKVEAGGYLEFVNETKDKDGNVNKYGYPVPSTVTFSLINGGGTT